MGINIVETFDYEGHLIKIRPLASAELDDCELKGYQYVDPGLARLIMLIRLKKVELNSKLDKIPPQMMESIDRYYREVNYWIVYHSMKQFMPDDFTVEDVRKMRYVHDIASKILDISSGTKKQIMKIIATPEGQELAAITLRLKIPLANEAWKLTPLQLKFYEIGITGADKIYETETDMKKALFGFDIDRVLEQIATGS